MACDGATLPDILDIRKRGSRMGNAATDAPMGGSRGLDRRRLLGLRATLNGAAVQYERSEEA
jgi:hypothetical protein